MKTKAVRMYGARDLRLEEFELPEMKEDEILVKVISDSICMLTYKLVEQSAMAFSLKINPSALWSQRSVRIKVPEPRK